MTLKQVKDEMNKIAERCHKSNIAFAGVAAQMVSENVKGEDRICERAECVVQTLSDDSGRQALIQCVDQCSRELVEAYRPQITEDSQRLFEAIFLHATDKEIIEDIESMTEEELDAELKAIGYDEEAAKARLKAKLIERGLITP